MEVATKICSKCKEVKPIKEFNKRKNSRCGAASWCKQCIKEHKKNDAIRIRIRDRKYYIDNIEKIKKYHAERYISKKEKILEHCKIYQKNNIEKIREYGKEYREKNVDKKRESDKNRTKVDPKFRLNHNIRKAIWWSLKGNKNGKSWEYLLGYTLQDLISHLEKLFKLGMTWENYGKWHIDHIVPQCLWQFNSYTDREFKQCWALCNLQPLWALENISKNGRAI